MNHASKFWTRYNLNKLDTINSSKRLFCFLSFTRIVRVRLRLPMHTSPPSLSLDELYTKLKDKERGKR